MVRANDRGDRIGKGDALQDFSADDGMDLHLFELFRRQSAGLVDDVLGNGELADIVQQRGSAKGFDFLGRTPSSFAISIA